MSEYLPYAILVFGIVCLGLSLFSNSAKSNLRETGIPVEGIIFKQEFSDGGNGSPDGFSGYNKDKITIRFVTETGEWITGVLKQDFSITYTGQYKNGEKIKLYYNKDNPSEFYVHSKQSEFIGKIMTALAGIILIIAGLYQLFAS